MSSNLKQSDRALIKGESISSDTTNVTLYNQTAHSLKLDQTSVGGSFVSDPTDLIAPGGQGTWIMAGNTLPNLAYVTYKSDSGNDDCTAAIECDVDHQNYIIDVSGSSNYKGWSSGVVANISYYLQQLRMEITLSNQAGPTLQLDPASLQIQDGEFISQPPTSIEGGATGSWTIFGKGVRGGCKYNLDDISWATLSWDLSNQKYSIDAEPTYEYQGNTSISGPSVGFTFFLTKLGATLHNQTNATLTLDPASVQNQDGEFLSQPPASIAPQGQGAWNVAGTKGSCTYQYVDGSGNSGSAELWWDRSDTSCEIETSGQGAYRGSSDNYPSLNFYFQPPDHANTGSHGQ